MSTVKISDAEYPLMEYIWNNEPMSAAKLSAYSLVAFNWKKNTTYTVLKRLIGRGALKREDPGFMVYPLVEKKVVQKDQLAQLLQKTFAGSLNDFIDVFMSLDCLSDEGIAKLKSML